MAGMAPLLRSRGGQAASGADTTDGTSTGGSSATGSGSGTDTAELMTPDAVAAAEPQDPKAARAARRAAKAQVGVVYRSISFCSTAYSA